MLEIQILGSPEILWNDQPVQIPRRIPRAILYYLSTFQNPVSRAEIMAIFWPDLDDRSARDSLRDNLAKLRKSLPDPEIIHADNLTICLEKSLVRVDFHLFQQLVNWIGRHPWQTPDDTPLSGNLVSQMEKAISLWRAPRMLYGAHLPDSQSLDEWLGSIEQSLYVKRDRIQDRLIHHYIACGNYDASIRFIDIGLSADPINEELHVLKLNTLILSGQRNEAIRYGQYIQELFQKEYHEQPSSQFAQILQKLKTEQKQADYTRPYAMQSLRNTQNQFIGRKDQLNSMKSAVQSGLVILIEGDIGVGKATLVKELIKQLQPAMRMLPAVCHPSTSVIPFQPLIEMIRSSIQSEEIAALDVHDQYCLSLLDPSFHLLKSYSGEHTLSLITENHPWIHESIFHLIRSVSKSQKPLLFIDKADAADDATLTTCRIMAKNRFLFSDACLILTRTKGVSNPVLDKLILDLTIQNRILQIKLEPLSPSEEKELIETVLAQPIGEPELEAIHRDTAGNPLLVIEHLRTTVLGSESSETNKGVFNIPVSLRAVLREQYLKFTPEMQTIAALVAISETPVQMEVLETASQILGEDTLLAIEELEKMAVILPEEDRLIGSLTYHYRQNIFRETVLLELSPTRKRLLHRRLAAAIESLRIGPIEKNAAILADHFETCGEYEKAYIYWNLNAEYARKLNSPGDANRSFQRAQNILTYIDNSFSDEQIAAFYQQWADLAYYSLFTDELLQIHQRLMEYGERRSSALLLGDGLACLSNRYYCINKYTDGLASIELALRYYQEANSTPRWLHGINRKAKCLYMLSRFPEASQVIESALASLPDRIDDATKKVQGNMLFDSALISIFIGNPALAVDQAEKSLRTFMQLHDMEGQVRVYGILMLAHTYTGDICKAESEGDLGLQLAERISYKRMQGYILAYLSSVKMRTGKLDDAFSLADQARKIGEEYQYPEIIALVERSIGDIYRFLGNLQMATQHYQLAFDLGGETIVKYENLSRLGNTLCIIGSNDIGNALLDDANRVAKQLSLRGVEIATEIYRLPAFKSKAFLIENKDYLESLLQECEDRGLRSQWGNLQGLLIRLDLYQNQLDKAEQRVARFVEEERGFEIIWLDRMIYDLSSHVAQFHPGLREKWLKTKMEYLNELDKNCHSVALRDSFLRFRKSIDKI